MKYEFTFIRNFLSQLPGPPTAAGGGGEMKRRQRQKKPFTICHRRAVSAQKLPFRLDWRQRALLVDSISGEENNSITVSQI
jgi:hypothetical protein